MRKWIPPREGDTVEVERVSPKTSRVEKFQGQLEDRSDRRGFIRFSDGARISYSINVMYVVSR